VDHGTAFDIVGRNRADCGSMKAAVELAIELARKRVPHVEVVTHPGAEPARAATAMLGDAGNTDVIEDE